MTDMTEAAALALREPFPEIQVGKLPRVTCRACREDKQRKHCDRHEKRNCGVCGNYITTAHMHLDYVGHAAVTDRLLKVDPEWSWEPMGVDAIGNPAIVKGELGEPGEPIGLWIKLTVCGVTRNGFGSGKTAKEAISDAIRNAAMRFGVALDLWVREGGRENDEDAPAAGSGAAAKPDAEIEATKLIKGAPRGENALQLIAEMQQRFEPSLDWAAIGAQLREEMYEQSDWLLLDGDQRLDYMNRYSNAMAALEAEAGVGDFPPVPDEVLIRVFAWAFMGTVIEIPTGEAALPSEPAPAAPAAPESGGDTVPVADGTEEAEADLEARERAQAEAHTLAEERAAAGSTGAGAYDRD